MTLDDIKSPAILEPQTYEESLATEILKAVVVAGQPGHHTVVRLVKQISVHSFDLRTKDSMTREERAWKNSQSITFRLWYEIAYSGNPGRKMPNDEVVGEVRMYRQHAGAAWKLHFVYHHLTSSDRQRQQFVLLEKYAQRRIKAAHIAHYGLTLNRHLAPQLSALMEVLQFGSENGRG